MTGRIVSLTYRLATFLSLCFYSIFHGEIIAETPFQDNGAGGFVSDQMLTIGPDGAVFELDAFVNMAGLDLNGAGVEGTSAQLGLSDPLPAGLDFSFSAEISADQTDLVLSYTFTNDSGVGSWD